MSPGRSWLLAAQTVLVGALIVVVSGTLLHSDPAKDWLGITTPGRTAGPPAPERTTPDRRVRGDDRKSRPGARRPPRASEPGTGGRAPQGVNAGVIPTTPSAPAAAPAPLARPHRGAEGPVEDTVARLLSRVN